MERLNLTSDRHCGERPPVPENYPRHSNYPTWAIARDAPLGSRNGMVWASGGAECAYASPPLRPEGYSMNQHLFTQTRRHDITHNYEYVDHNPSGQPPFVPNHPSSFGGPHYASPDTGAWRLGHPSVPVLAHLHNISSPQLQYPLESIPQSSGQQILSLMHGEATSTHVHHSAVPPYSNIDHQVGAETPASPPFISPTRIAFDEVHNPPLDIQARISAYGINGEVPPATMYTASDGIVVPSYSYANERNDHTSWQPYALDNNTHDPSVGIISTRAHLCHSSREHAPSSSTSTAHSTDSYASVSTRSRIYSLDEMDRDPILNEAREPHVGQPTELLDQSLPRNTSLFWHENVPRDSVGSTWPDYGVGEVSPTSPYTMYEGHSAASSPTLTDEEPDNFHAKRSLEKALGHSSPLTNEALRKLLFFIIELPSVRRHQFEPRISSNVGQALLRRIELIPGYPPNGFDISNDSIFTLYVTVVGSEFQCRICGKSKQSMVRGIGCVRMHLKHRPYVCDGKNGCKSCPKHRIAKRFCTASSLHDHLKKQRELKCPLCQRVLMGSITRHLRSTHSASSRLSQ